jgi:hypothetical protein
MPIKSTFQRLMKKQEGFRKPMLEAILAGDLEKIDELVADGADVNAQFDTDIKIGKITYCNTAQHYALFAAVNEKFDVILHLKKHRLDLNKPFISKHTLLTAFCTFKWRQFIQPEHITALVRLGADAKEKDGHGQNAVHVLSYQDTPDPYDKHDKTVDTSTLIGVLMDAGCDVDAQNAGGNTALHLAAQSVTPPPVIRFLLGRGASALIKNNDGLTASELSQNNPHKQNDPTPLFLQRRNEEAAQIVVEALSLSPAEATQLNAERPKVALKTRRGVLKL